MKYIFWGFGNFLKKRMEMIDLSKIICIVDKNNAVDDEMFRGINIVSPERIRDYSYDAIVITASKFFDEIAYELMFSYGVDVNKIWNWEYFCSLTGSETTDRSTQYYKLVKDIYQKFAIRKILDESSHLYGFLPTLGFKTDTVPVNKKYELALRSSDNGKNIAKWVILTKDKKLDKAEVMNIKNEMKQFNYQGYLFDVITKKRCTIHIYEVTHKSFVPLGISGYYPIHAGKSNKADFGYIGDNTGDNISNHNALINECTALYWMWKNDTASIVGLNHYRRFFASPMNLYWALQEFEIQMLLDKYEMIVADPYIYWSGNVKEGLRSTVCEEAFYEGYGKLCTIFEKRDNKERNTFEYVFNSKMLYHCNMFITTKKRMHEYCSWLFPILFELIETVEIKEDWDNYSKRIIGFIAERLLTVWIVLTKCKVKELPIIVTDTSGSYGK